MGDNGYLPFQKKKKKTNISKNNFKIDIKRIYGRLKMCKNIITINPIDFQKLFFQFLYLR